MYLEKAQFKNPQTRNSLFDLEEVIIKLKKTIEDKFIADKKHIKLDKFMSALSKADNISQILKIISELQTHLSTAFGSKYVPKDSFALAFTYAKNVEKMIVEENDQADATLYKGIPTIGAEPSTASSTETHTMTSHASLSQSSSNYEDIPNALEQARAKNAVEKADRETARIAKEKVAAEAKEAALKAAKAKEITSAHNGKIATILNAVNSIPLSLGQLEELFKGLSAEGTVQPKTFLTNFIKGLEKSINTIDQKYKSQLSKEISNLSTILVTLEKITKQEDLLEALNKAEKVNKREDLKEDLKDQKVQIEKTIAQLHTANNATIEKHKEKLSLLKALSTLVNAYKNPKSIQDALDILGEKTGMQQKLKKLYTASAVLDYADASREIDSIITNLVVMQQEEIKDEKFEQYNQIPVVSESGELIQSTTTLSAKVVRKPPTVDNTYGVLPSTQAANPYDELPTTIAPKTDPNYGALPDATPRTNNSIYAQMPTVLGHKQAQVAATQDPNYAALPSFGEEPVASAASHPTHYRSIPAAPEQNLGRERSFSNAGKQPLWQPAKISPRDAFIMHSLQYPASLNNFKEFIMEMCVQALKIARPDVGSKYDVLSNKLLQILNQLNTIIVNLPKTPDKSAAIQKMNELFDFITHKGGSATPKLTELMNKVIKNEVVDYKNNASQKAIIEEIKGAFILEASTMPESSSSFTH